MLRPIKTEEDYKKALNRIDLLMDKEDQDSLDELEVLSLLVEKYEDVNFPIDAPDPIEAIKFRMEQMGLTNKDIEKSFGGQNRVSEVMNKKRKLNLRMIQSLHKELDIPYESLIGA